MLTGFTPGSTRTDPRTRYIYSVHEYPNQVVYDTFARMECGRWECPEKAFEKARLICRDLTEEVKKKRV